MQKQTIALIDDEIFISTVKESIINNPDENNPIYLNITSYPL